MASALESHGVYAQFIFSLLAARPAIERHTIEIYTISRTVGIARGQIVFSAGYDPMPHPDVPELQSTHPHHKHVHPDIKRHRIPAPGISFTEANLPFLIDEMEALLAEAGQTASA